MLKLTSALPAPHVDTTHLYGTGVDTGLRYSWAHDDKFESAPKTASGPGDGTVNLASLRSVSKWKAEQRPEGEGGGEASTSYAFEELTFAGQSHTGILSHQPYIAAVLRILGLNATGPL